MKCDTADSVEGGTQAGRLQSPASRCLDMADPLLWNRSSEPSSGSSRGLRNRPLPCPRYQVTRAVAQRRAAAGDGGATEVTPFQLARRGRRRAGRCVLRERLEWFVQRSCRATLPTLLSAQTGGAALEQLQECDGRAANGCREEDWGRRRISRARGGGLRVVWHGVVEARAHAM